MIAFDQNDSLLSALKVIAVDRCDSLFNALRLISLDASSDDGLEKHCF